MALTCRLLAPSFIAEVEGVDFSRPVSDIAFSRLLGTLEHAPSFFGKGIKRFAHPELFDAGNLDASGNILVDERRRLYNKGNDLWHTDSSFYPHRSA